jgi:hypothetical protein
VKYAGENCEQHCITSAQVHTARWMFLIPLAVWLGYMAVRGWRYWRADLEELVSQWGRSADGEATRQGGRGD